MMDDNVVYRLNLARGFLAEAEQDLTLERWRTAVSHAQLSAENGLKGVIALFVPVAKTHDPARILVELIARGQIPAQWHTAEDAHETVQLARTILAAIETLIEEVTHE